MVENSNAEKIEIDCYKLNTILENHKIQKVDYLNVDAEGNDFKVISTFDFKKYKPSLISIEYNNYNFENLMNSDINILLEKNEFKIVSKFGVTCFYVHKRNIDKIEELMKL